jgi:N-glycosylase/DNA lyase
MHPIRDKPAWLSMRSISVDDFDLSATLESGQIFRYVRLAEGYLIHHRDRVLQVRQNGRVLYFDGADEGFLLHFLALDEDYQEITRNLEVETTVRNAMARHWGLRILRQDPWECLVSFLCSSTKSVTHIRVMIEHLCRAFGKPVSLGHYRGYGFPSEGTIRDGRRLEEIGLGFRAGYIHRVNQIIREGYFEEILREPYQEAKARLMQLPGVGDKVADCVLLFSMGFSQSFPVDRWIKRGMEQIYFHGERISPRRIRAFALEHFGPFAGYAQQFLYHDWRTKGRFPKPRPD